MKIDNVKRDCEIFERVLSCFDNTLEKINNVKTKDKGKMICEIMDELEQFREIIFNQFTKRCDLFVTLKTKEIERNKKNK